MIVLDSSFLIAFHNERDIHHTRSADVMARFMDGEWGAGMLLEYVFLEVVTVLRMRLDVTSAGRVGEILLQAKELEFIPCYRIFTEAFAIFRTAGHAPLSFTDAAIAAVARGDPPGFVATYDKDFARVDGVRVVG